MAEEANSLSDDATFAGRAPARPQRAEVSLGDERTLGGGEGAGLDAVTDDIEVVDLEARYKIEGTLGQGGMGAVLLATDTRLDRKVAIKRILGEAARSKAAIMRFLTEAKAIAALNHPNIVQIYDYGRAKDGPFLIMEHVDGGSLADRCSEGALPLDTVVSLACQLCEGLAKAHDAGIIHRDIKPANVLINTDGLPKLTDFGLAKAETADHGMTMAGAVMGTPDFMPPEQRRDAAEVDHRSDLWSLAATVYQIVTGRSPKVIDLRHVPERLRDVLARALEDEKEARYQSAREFREAMGDHASRTGRGTAPSSDSLLEGQCPACGTRNADPSRKFCRNPECVASLRVKCLGCEMQIPVWDAICGECGVNQPKKLAELRTAIVAKRTEAESRLAGLAFDDAVSIATSLAAITAPQLREHSEWATAFAERVKSERQRCDLLAATRLAEAAAHREANDFRAAIQSLRSVPETLRTPLIQQRLQEYRSLQNKTNDLVSLINRRTQAKQFDGLTHLVRRTRALLGDRRDLTTLHHFLVTQKSDRIEVGIDHAITAWNNGDEFDAIWILRDLRRTFGGVLDEAVDSIAYDDNAPRREALKHINSKLNAITRPPQTAQNEQRARATPKSPHASAQHFGLDDDDIDWSTDSFWSCPEGPITKKDLETLAKADGHADLNFVDCLTVDQAAALAFHRGHLLLNNLRTISKEAASRLADHDGPVSVKGLTGVTAEAMHVMRSSGKFHFAETLTDPPDQDRKPGTQ